MPRSYVPVLMGLKLPEIFSLLACAGVAGALVAACRSALTPRTRAVLLAVALAAVLPVAVTVIARPAMYNGIRHFVFVLPPLAVAGGLAGAWIARATPRALALWRLARLAVVFAAGVALPVIGMARLHPYEYAAYNQIVGGVRGAQPLYMLDYWGLAFKQAGNELRDRLAARGEAPARRPEMEDRGVRPASAGADCARADIRADLGPQGRGLRARRSARSTARGSTRPSLPRWCATA